MAVSVLSDFSSALVKKFDDRITMQINRSTPLLQLLRVVAGRGQNIQWVVRTGTGTGAAIADGTDLGSGDYKSDTKTAAVLAWPEYVSAFGISGRAVDAAMAAGNPAELADLFANELEEAVTRLAKVIGLHIFSGNGSASPAQITGLDTSIGTSGNTYATIDRGSITQFDTNVTAVNDDLDFSVMRTMRQKIYTASGYKPDLVVTTPILHEKYAQLFGQNRRYMQEVFLRGQKITLDGGYQVLEFDGIPVVEDINATAGQMYFINTQFVEVQYLPHAASMMSRMNGNELGIHGTGEEQFGEPSDKLRAKILPIAVTGNAAKFGLYLTPQVVVKRPGACGVLTGLTET